MKFETTRPSSGPHARAVGVEDADDAGVEAVEPVVRHRHGLGEALGLVVHAAGADRVDVAPVGLGLRVDLGVAVDLADVEASRNRAPLAWARPSVLWVPRLPTFSVWIGISR